MKNILLICAVLFLMVSVLGCNTYKGAGEDVQGMGKTMQKQSQ